MINNLTTADCYKVLKSNYIGHLAYILGKNPYVLPMTYFYDDEEKSILSYSAQGHKVNAMRKHKDVALQVDEIQSIQKWHSILVHGRFEELDGSTAKKYLHKFSMGVQDTIAKNTQSKPGFLKDFSSRLQSENTPIVYRIQISDISGKSRNNKTN